MNGSEEMEIEQRALTVTQNRELTVADVTNQVKKIQEVMKSVMRENEHYGVIPGCKKPSLLKPGAEKLGLTFLLKPKFKVNRFDMPNGHREYEVQCELIHTPSGTFQGDGLGSCSTMEAKYRFRTGEVNPTGKPVPQGYWNKRDKNLIGGAGFGVKKIDGNWQIVEMGEKVEHDNPADYYNTVLKMAKKRAHVDAMLTATAASDIFTQDVEDLPEFQDTAETTDKKAPTKPQDSPQATQAQSSSKQSPKQDNASESKYELNLEQKKKLIWEMLLQITTDAEMAKSKLTSITKGTGAGGKKFDGIDDVKFIKSDAQAGFIIGKIKPEFIKQFSEGDYRKLETMATTKLI